MTGRELREELEDLIITAQCALQDFDRQCAGDSVMIGFQQHLKDLWKNSEAIVKDLESTKRVRRANHG